MTMKFDLKNHLLIAMPHLNDPHFKQTVTYICDHNEKGAMGIVINRPLKITLGKVLEQLEISNDDPDIAKHPVLGGGPIGIEQGFIIHRPCRSWKTTFVNSDAVAITTSRDILQDIAKGHGPQKNLISLGYAGWQAGQLEAEMAENAWLTTLATEELMFDRPFHDRWQAAIHGMGIDITSLSSEIGHA